MILRPFSDGQLDGLPDADAQQVRDAVPGQPRALRVEVYANLTHTSRATAQRELSDLVSKGVLGRNPGGGRSASYDLVWEDYS